MSIMPALPLPAMLRRLLYARKARAVAGKDGSVSASASASPRTRPSRSKTGLPECSSAASAWKTGKATAETFLMLARCRASAGAKTKATLHRAAGNDLKAAVLERRAAKNLASPAHRADQADQLRMARGMRQAVKRHEALKGQPVPPPPRPHAGTPAPVPTRTFKLKPPGPAQVAAREPLLKALETRMLAESAGVKGISPAVRPQLWEQAAKAYREAQPLLKASRAEQAARKAAPSGRTELTAADVGRILAGQHNKEAANKGAEQQEDRWVSSKKFVRMRIPIDSATPASEVRPGDRSRSTGPIIVDKNKTGAGRHLGLFGAPADHLILDGKHRVAEARARGETHIEAFVGVDAIPGIRAISEKQERSQAALKAAIERHKTEFNGSSLRSLKDAASEAGISGEGVERLRERIREERGSAGPAHDANPFVAERRARQAEYEKRQAEAKRRDRQARAAALKDARRKGKLPTGRFDPIDAAAKLDKFAHRAVNSAEPGNLAERYAGADVDGPATDRHDRAYHKARRKALLDYIDRMARPQIMPR